MEGQKCTCVNGWPDTLLNILPSDLPAADRDTAEAFNRVLTDTAAPFESSKLPYYVLVIHNYYKDHFDRGGYGDPFSAQSLFA